MILSRSRSDKGLTRLESAVMTSLLIVGLAVGAVFLFRAYPNGLTGGTLNAQGGSAGQITTADAPTQVNVVAPGTIAVPPGEKRSRRDACPDLRGRQPAGFDCSLPLYVPALDLSAVRVKARFQCPDADNYRLVKGQTVQPDKKCILKTAEAGGR